ESALITLTISARVCENFDSRPWYFTGAPRGKKNRTKTTPSLSPPEVNRSTMESFWTVGAGPAVYFGSTLKMMQSTNLDATVSWVIWEAIPGPELLPGKRTCRE